MMKVASVGSVGLALSLLGSVAVGEPDNTGDLDGLSGRVFLAEITIVASSILPELEGYMFPTCFFFNADGSFVDTEWPGQGQDPIPGVWVQHTDLPKVRFTATADFPALGWNLIEYGIAQPARGTGNQKLTTYATIFSAEDDLLIYAQGEGHAVESCPL